MAYSTDFRFALVDFGLCEDIRSASRGNYGRLRKLNVSYLSRLLFFNLCFSNNHPNAHQLRRNVVNFLKLFLFQILFLSDFSLP